MRGPDLVDARMTADTDDDFPRLDWVLRWLWTGFAWLGFFATVALIGFLWGYWA